MASARSLRSKRRQTRLQFQPLPSSSPAKEEYSHAIQNRLAKVRYEGAELRKLALPNNEDGASLPTPEPSSQARMNAQTVTSPLTSLHTSPPLPPRFTNIHSDPSSGSEDDIVLPSSKRRKVQSSREQDSIDTRSPWQSRRILHSMPTRRSSRLQKSSPPALRSASTTPNQRMTSVDVPQPTEQLSDLGSAETSDDDDVMTTQPTTRMKATKSRPADEDTFVVDDDDIQYLSSDHAQSKTDSRTCKRGTRDDFVVSNDEIEYVTEDEDESQEARLLMRKDKSQRSQVPKIPKRRSRREQEELEEDLLDLQDSDGDEDITRSRTRGGPVTTQRDKARGHLDLLKKRRAGQRAPRMIQSDEEFQEDEDSEGVDIDNIDREIDEAQGFTEDGVAVGGNGIQDRHPVYVVDDDDDDFVVEDTITEGRLGRPNTDIPLQFTSFASAKPKELFVHVVEWMAKNKISPAFNRDDDVYSISFARIDDQVKAQAGSRLISSAWSATFKHAVLARPNMRVTALPGLDEDHIRTCDACNKSNHPARYDFTFSGKAYFQATLEPVEDSDGEDEDTRDTVSHDEQGHELASESIHFYLGRFCAANAEMGHKLTHWKHRLNEQVLEHLEEQGVLSAEAIVSRDKLNKKKREREAESIVDMMQDTGMISELWQTFKDDLEDARIGMEGHERKGGRSKARIGSIRIQRDDGTIGEWVEGSKFRQVGRIESDSEGE